MATFQHCRGSVSTLHPASSPCDVQLRWPRLQLSSSRSRRCSSTAAQAAAPASSSSGSGMRQLSPSSSAPPAPSTPSTPSTPPSPVMPTSSTVPLTSAPPPPRPSYRVSFFDAMKFNGPAPELINGRLAMIGLLAAGVRESETGETVLHQLNHISLGTCVVLAVWVYASMVPLLKGVKQEAFGPFTPRAELTNGRAAMLGFAVLCALEYSAGVPFF